MYKDKKPQKMYFYIRDKIGKILSKNNIHIPKERRDAIDEVRELWGSINSPIAKRLLEQIFAEYIYSKPEDVREEYEKHFDKQEANEFNYVLPKT